MRTRKGPSTPSTHSNTPYLTEKQEKNYTGQPTSTRKWSKQENQAYIEFLQDSRKLFDLSSTRRSQKIFLQMSLFVRTRSPDQCRTHHQKIFNRYGSIDKILANFLEGQPRKKPGFENEEKTLCQDEFFKLRQIGPHVFCIKIDESRIQEW